MRILIIPIDQKNHPKKSLRVTTLFNEIEKNNNQILGLERVPYFNTSIEHIKYIRFLFYMFKLMFYGLKRGKKIDLILCHTIPFGLTGAIISFFIRKPLIWDNLDGNLSSHFKLLNTSFIYNQLNTLFERLIGSIAKIIIVPSENDKKLYFKQEYKYKNKIKVIPTGTDLSTIKKTKEDKNLLRQKLRLDPEKKVLIFSGKRDYPPNKEAAFWINDKLAPVLAERFNQLQIVVTGVGEVPQKIHPIVTFPGHVPDYFEHILASDVCLVPYQMNTGISTKLIDYLACGKPTVTTVEVARLFPELVDGENVLIARDRKEFIEKTIAILENPVLGEKIGANGRKVIEEHYNIEVIGKLWQEVFESCVSNPKPFI